ncbi:SDR family oxidoreductase [Membranicola marinus]|uniref:SDR family oxidoreductase n=1 Tax=Membranihabitans marinus TaxID=1227546 RepID=A0A953L7K9_9BACT|nr:SDR family oxidoreductase [Membranihabitans marinus]MBY5958827.1 SDR family oxidoreductase [Membranihabitans marinus]
MSTFNIQGKKIVISGGTGVLGQTAVSYFLAQGAKVCILNRNPDKLEKLLEDWRDISGDVFGFSGDVTDEKFLQKVRAGIVERWTSIDVLVNAAGGNMPGAVIQPDSSFFDASVSDLRKVFDLNLMGTLLPTYVLADLFPKDSHSSVINYSSMSADRVITRVLGYSMAKGAVDIFTKWLAVEFATKYGERIRVNAVAPGFFLTEQNKNLLTNTDETLTSRGESIIQNTPFGRFGRAEELNGILQFLMSDASSFMTGTVIPVDGGFSAFSGV